MTRATEKHGKNGVRRMWVAPRVSRMKASDAAAGANPLVPEGPIAMGS